MRSVERSVPPTRRACSPTGVVMLNASSCSLVPSRQYEKNRNGPSARPSFELVVRASGEAAQPLPPPALKPTPASSYWNALTDKLVRLSVIPFLILLAPQLIKNAAAMASGNSSALSILSWTGYSTGWLGNTLLLSYFLQEGEGSAVIVQAVGVVSNLLLLTQLLVSAHMPLYAWSIVAAISTAGLTLAALRASLCESKGGRAILAFYSRALNCLGLAVVPQVLVWTLLDPHCGLYPGGVALSLGLVTAALDAAGALPPTAARLWAKVSGCTATALFALQPIAQLARNLTLPSSLTGLSAPSIALGMAGNALMLPRALFVRDYIWLFGSAWGCLAMGWGQLLSLKLGEKAVGTPLLPTPVFALISLALLTYYGWVILAARSWHDDGPQPLAMEKKTA